MMKRTLTQKTKTFLIALCALIFLGVLLMVGTAAGGVKLLAKDRCSTTEKRVAFLAECGWQADPASEQSQQILIPTKFSDVYESYNQLQRQQGYDLSDFTGRSCTLYAYQVLNYPDKSQTVIADLYVYKNQIIGGDVHSTDLGGFMIGLK